MLYMSKKDFLVSLVVYNQRDPIKRLMEKHGGDPYPLIASNIIAEDMGVRMTEDYFEIKISKATKQYGF